MKVSQKVVLISSAIVVITFTLFSWLQYNSVKDTLYQKAESNVTETSTVIAKQITDWLNGKLALVDMVAKTIDGNYSPDNIQQAFDNPILKDHFILMFGGLHTDGKPITNDSSWNPEGWDARKRPWYQVARNNSIAALTDPYADASSGEILISAVANITDQGRFLGAFGGDLSLQLISETLNTVTFDNTGYTFLINNQGSIISHPDKALNGKNLSEVFEGKQPELRSHLQQLSVAGKQVFTSFQPLVGLQGSQWFIGVILNRDQVLQQATDFGVAALIGTLLSVLLCSLALFLTMKSLLSPLQHLQASLVDINSGDGDLTKRLNVESKDEFGNDNVAATQFKINYDTVSPDVLITADK
ncbi:MAG: HAMP domain-containing protein, partial [Pseudomonadales bacterium]